MCKSENDSQILSILQKPLQLVPEPFEFYSQKMGLNVEQVISLFKKNIESGIIRRFAGIVKHNKAGYLYNAMVAFEIDENLCDQTGEILSRFPYISHCYRRTSYGDWPYNVYAMMHAKDKSEFENQLAEMKNAIQYKSISVLRSLKEYKKSQFMLT